MYYEVIKKEFDSPACIGLVKHILFESQIFWTPSSIVYVIYKIFLSKGAKLCFLIHNTAKVFTQQSRMDFTQKSCISQTEIILGTIFFFSNCVEKVFSLPGTVETMFLARFVKWYWNLQKKFQIFKVTIVLNLHAAGSNKLGI